MRKAVLHICDYSASYRGNFIESLEYLAKKDNERKHIYLFPERANRTGALEWIMA